MESLWKAAGALTITALVIAALYFCVSYRKDTSITVIDRWWAYTTDVKYSEDHTRWVNGYYTGTGDDRKYVPGHTEQYTDTHTRCSNHATGRTLPAIAPQPACPMQYGDYLSSYVSYKLKFKEGNNEPVRNFNLAMWDRLAPGAMRQVQVDLLGNLQGFAKE